jgi:murein DD-endopeptidase MepM/ murein hydrolase activator NlpD
MKVVLVIICVGALGFGVYSIMADRSSAPDVPADRILTIATPDFTEVLSADNRWFATREDRPEESRGGRRPGSNRFEGSLQENDTLFLSMQRTGLESDSIQAVVAAFTGTFDFRRSRPGDSWTAVLDHDGSILRFSYRVSAEELYEAARSGQNGYDVNRTVVPTETVIDGFGGTIVSSLYATFEEVSEDPALAGRYIAIFGWDIDFGRESQPGDTIRIVFERVHLDGEFLRYGRVLAAEYRGAALNLRAYSYATGDGEIEYYDPDGQALRRTFLRAPLVYRRISSTFSRRRYHPILRRYRAHLGVDYAARTGTPIWALADGEVDFAGRNGGHGNMIRLDHANHHRTSYSHLSAFATGLSRGDNVRQGQVIGFVGSTGLSTGPHLHFGVRYRGRHIDPLTLGPERGPPLEGEGLLRFQEQVRRWELELDSIEIALVDPLELRDEPPEQGDLPGDFGMEIGDE